LYWHEWARRWGVSPNPWAGDAEVPNIVLRRELVFVSGERQRQVLDRSALTEGTFLVDESRGRIWLKPGRDVDLAASLVEVGVRDVLWDQNHEDHVVVRGLVFQHAATPWEVARAAVRVSASDGTTFEHCTIVETNWTGLYVGESTGVRLRNLVLNYNGGQGWAMFRVRDLVVKDSETSYNNWRGALGGFTGWSVGNKILSAHRLRIHNHRAVGNASRGLWLDYDIADAVIDSLVAIRNERDGIWIEASQGPITITRSTISDNAEAGIHSTFSRNVVVDSNTIVGNSEAQLKIGGASTRAVRDFESGRDLYLSAGGWVITHNVFGMSSRGGTDDVLTVLGTEAMSDADWSGFARTLVSDENVFRAPGSAVAFRVMGRRIDLASWRRLTGQDDQSTSGGP
jgi:parallel beta-helix repeat protein